MVDRERFCVFRLGKCVLKSDGPCSKKRPIPQAPLDTQCTTVVPETKEHPVQMCTIEYVGSVVQFTVVCRIGLSIYVVSAVSCSTKGLSMK